MAKVTKDRMLEMIREGGNLTTSQQLRLTALLSYPAIFAQLSAILMEYIDAAMVGSLGANASASIGLVATSTWLMWGLSSAISTGFSVQVAHRIGASEMDKARSILRQSITVAIIGALVLAIIGVAISFRLPYWLGGEEAINRDATLYFLIFAASMPMIVLNSLSGMMLRCSGNTLFPGMVNVGMCLADVVFNFFLIFPTRTIWGVTVPGVGLGVTGAAVGTSLAMTVGMVIMLVYLVKKNKNLNLSGRPGSFKPERDVLKKALIIGGPVGLERILMNSAQIAITMIVAPLGTIAIAANSFAVTAESLCYMPGYGIGEAATTLVGQSIGAGRKKLSRRFAYITVVSGMIIMGIMGAIMWLGADIMMGIITPVESIRSLGAEVLRVEAWAEPMFAAAIVSYGVFVGAGDTVVPSCMNLGSIWIVRLTLAALLAPVMGLRGVWIAMAAELGVRGLLFLWRLFSHAWQKN